MSGQVGILCPRCLAPMWQTGGWSKSWAPVACSDDCGVTGWINLADPEPAFTVSRWWRKRLEERQP